MAPVLEAYIPESALLVGAGGFVSTPSPSDCGLTADIRHCHCDSVTGLDTGRMVAGVHAHCIRLAAAVSLSDLGGHCASFCSPSGVHRSAEIHALPQSLRVCTPVGLRDCLLCID